MASKDYNGGGFSQEGDGGVFGKPGGTDVGLASDYDVWDWKQIEAAIKGMAAGVGDEASLAKASAASSPQTLLEAANIFEYVRVVLQGVADSMLAQAKALAGTDGPWKGSAADAFYDMMATFSKQVAANAEVLSGGTSGTHYVPQELADNSATLTNAQNAIGEIDVWYANQAILMGVQPMSNGLIPISKKPELVAMMTSDMRKVLKSLAANYQVTIDGIKSPKPVTTPPPGGGDTDKKHQGGGGGAGGDQKKQFGGGGAGGDQKKFSGVNNPNQHFNVPPPAKQKAAVSPPVHSPAVSPPVKSPAVHSPAVSPPVKSPAVHSPAVSPPVKQQAVVSPPVNSPAVHSPAVSPPVNSPAVHSPAVSPPVNSPAVNPQSFVSPPPVNSPAVNPQSFVSPPPVNSPDVNAPGGSQPANFPGDGSVGGGGGISGGLPPNDFVASPFPGSAGGGAGSVNSGSGLSGGGSGQFGDEPGAEDFPGDTGKNLPGLGSSDVGLGGGLPGLGSSDVGLGGGAPANYPGGLGLESPAPQNGAAGAGSGFPGLGDVGGGLGSGNVNSGSAFPGGVDVGGGSGEGSSGAGMPFMPPMGGMGGGAPGAGGGEPSDASGLLDSHSEPWGGEGVFDPTESPESGVKSGGAGLDLPSSGSAFPGGVDVGGGSGEGSSGAGMPFMPPMGGASGGAPGAGAGEPSDASGSLDSHSEPWTDEHDLDLSDASHAGTAAGGIGLDLPDRSEAREQQDGAHVQALPWTAGEPPAAAGRAPMQETSAGELLHGDGADWSGDGDMTDPLPGEAGGGEGEGLTQNPVGLPAEAALAAEGALLGRGVPGRLAGAGEAKSRRAESRVAVVPSMTEGDQTEDFAAWDSGDSSLVLPLWSPGRTEEDGNEVQSSGYAQEGEETWGSGETPGMVGGTSAAAEGADPETSHWATWRPNRPGETGNSASAQVFDPQNGPSCSDAPYDEEDDLDTHTSEDSAEEEPESRSYADLLVQDESAWGSPRGERYDLF